MKIWFTILMIGLAIVLGIVEQWGLAIIFALVGIFFPVDGGKKSQPKSTARGTSATPTRPVSPIPVRVPVAGSPAIPYNRRNIIVPGAPAVDAYAYHGSQHEYFQKLLTAAFPHCTLRCDVPVTQIQSHCPDSWTCTCGAINATPFCGNCGARQPSLNMSLRKYAPVSFLLCVNGTPKVALMLGSRYDKDSPSYQNTIRYLERNHIPVQYYIDTFRNKASYVYSRVADSL